MTARAPAAHLQALTGIRGIAAWFVVLYHIRLSLQELLPAPVIAAFGKGYLAVDLFFILSGFVLWYNYADRLRGGGLAGAGDFMWRRIARIWPLHLFVLAGFVALAVLLALSGRSTAGYPFAELPLHVALVQNWGFTSDLSWNHPAWSISTELAAYLLFPLVVGAAAWERLPTLALLTICAGLLVGLHLIFAVNGLTSLGEAITRLGLWRCLIGFSLGNIACILWQRWRERRHAGMIVALAGAAGLTAGWLLALPETAFVPLCFLCAIVALALDRGVVSRMLGSKLCVWLGEISYSTYLVHFLLFIVAKMLLVDGTLQLGWAGLLAYLAAVLVASVVLYRAVEKPAQQWLNARRPRQVIASAG